MLSRTNLRLLPGLAALTVLSATNSFAQDPPVILNLLGDTLSLGDDILQILHPRIADNGDYMYLANTNHATQDSVLIHNGQEILRTQDVLPLGLVVEGIQSCDLSNTGEILLHLTLDNAPGSAILDRATVGL